MLKNWDKTKNCIFFNNFLTFFNAKLDSHSAERRRETEYGSGTENGTPCPHLARVPCLLKRIMIFLSLLTYDIYGEKAQKSLSL